MPEINENTSIELFVFDRLAPTSMVNMVSTRYEPSYMEELNGPGGGTFQIPIDDAKLVESATLLNIRNIVQVRVGGKPIGGFLIKKTAPTLISTDEFAGQVIEVSGPGLREWFKDAVLYTSQGKLSNLASDQRVFSFASEQGSWYSSYTWTAAVNMSRQDAQAPLIQILIASPIKAGVQSDAPATDPGGRPKLTNGFRSPGYQLYGTTSNPATYWWDAAGFHPVITSVSGAPAAIGDHKRYPVVIAPGYVAYGYVDPTTLAWGNAQINYYWDGTQRIADDVTAAGQPAPPGWTDNNPWRILPADWPDAPHARWMWDREARVSAPVGDVYFRREFTISGSTDQKCALFVTADDGFKAYVDGQLITESTTVSSENQTFSGDITLEPGSHVLAIKGINSFNGPAAVLAALFSYGDPAAPIPAKPIVVSGDGSWVCVGYPTNPPSWTVGEILIKIIDEARARNVTSMAYFDITFTGSLDSAGQTWDRKIDWSFDVGSDYEDILQKLEELSCDTAILPESGNSWTFNAWQERGSDLSGTVQLLPAHNIVAADDSSEINEMKNVLLLKSDDGWEERSIANGGYGRIEGFLSVGGTKNFAEQVADITLQKYSIPEDSTTIDYVVRDSNTPWKDFYVGDYVMGPKSNGQEPRRVASISVTEDRDNALQLKFVSEFGTIKQSLARKLERWLKSMVDGSLSGSVVNTSRPLPPSEFLGTGPNDVIPDPASDPGSSTPIDPGDTYIPPYIPVLPGGDAFTPGGLSIGDGGTYFDGPSGDGYIGDDLSVGNDLFVTNDGKINGDLTVGGNAQIAGDLTVNTINGQYLMIENVNNGGNSGVAVTLPDVFTATIHRYTLTANCTFTFPAATPGKSLTIELKQDSTGSRIVFWPGTVLWPAAQLPTLTTTANRTDIFAFMCSSAGSWRAATIGQNYL